MIRQISIDESLKSLNFFLLSHEISLSIDLCVALLISSFVIVPPSLVLSSENISREFFSVLDEFKEKSKCTSSLMIFGGALVCSTSPGRSFFKLLLAFLRSLLVISKALAFNAGWLLFL